MTRFINDFHGIVWSMQKDTMEIQLPRGGKIIAPKTKGIHVGDKVAFLMDACDRHVIQVILKEAADKQVKRGSNHFFDSACRNAPIEEEDYARDYTESRDVLWCPELT